MSDTARSSTNTLVMGLVVVVVALAAVLAYSIWNNSTKVPGVSEVSASSPAGTGNPGAAAPAAGGSGSDADSAQGMGAADGPLPGSEPAAFDAKTATKVPKGTTPLEFVKAYHEDIVQGKYEEAYKMLPLDKQQSYGDATKYAEQVKAYGITSYELGEPTESGDTWSISATQVTPQMPITYTWTLKKVGDQWYVASRAMGGG